MSDLIENFNSKNANCTNFTLDHHETIIKVLVAFIMSFISISAVVGNFIVILAMMNYKKLRTVSNMFILSLSMSDFCLGLFVMPLSASYTLLDKWIWGKFICLSWLSIDYTASTASIFNLLALSFERMLSISDPLKYISYKTKSNARIVILLVWLISSLWLLPINFWEKLNFSNYSTDKIIASNNKSLEEDQSSCVTYFETNYKFKLIATLFNFYIPLASIIIIYTKIFLSIRERSKSDMGKYYLKTQLDKPKTTDRNLHPINHQHTLEPSCESLMKSYNLNNINNNNNNNKTISNKKHLSTNQLCSSASNINSHYDAKTSDTESNVDNKIVNEKSNEKNSDKIEYDSDQELKRSFTLTKMARKTKSGDNKKLLTLRLKQQRKAAKKLGILVLVFLLTWLPYFIIFIVIAICQECIPTNLSTMTIWLGYLNSSINPILYPLCSNSFRNAFRDMFKFKSEKKSISSNHKKIVVINSIDLNKSTMIINRKVKLNGSNKRSRK